MSLFVNYRIPLHVLDTVEYVQDTLQQCGVQGDWQMLHRSHITLAVYDSLPYTRLGDVKLRLAAMLAEIPSFTLSFEGLGTFDNPSDRVIWLRPAPYLPLLNLHQRLSWLDVSNNRFPIYQPHVTLVTKANDVELPSIEIPTVTFNCEEVILSSDLHGVSYQILETFPLKTKRLLRG